MHNNPTRLAESEILANQVQTSLIRETGAVNRGVRRETFAVLRETAIPAILVELGFMDNPSELQKLNKRHIIQNLQKLWLLVLIIGIVLLVANHQQLKRLTPKILLNEFR